MKKNVSSETLRPLLVDLKGLSKYVSLSVPTLRKYIAAGMPHIKPGRKVLVDPLQAVDWLAQATHSGVQEDGDLVACLDEILSQF